MVTEVLQEKSITSKEKIIKHTNFLGVHLFWVSEFSFKVSTKDLVLLQDNREAINSFSENGYREDDLIEKWSKVKELPKWIYFFKQEKNISYKDLEKIYGEIMSPVKLNLLAAFNSKYPNFYKKFPNATQMKNSEGKFCFSIFSGSKSDNFVNLYTGENDGSFNFYFTGVLKK